MTFSCSLTSSSLAGIDERVCDRSPDRWDERFWERSLEEEAREDVLDFVSQIPTTPGEPGEGDLERDRRCGVDPGARQGERLRTRRLNSLSRLDSLESAREPERLLSEPVRFGVATRLGERKRSCMAAPWAAWPA